MKRKLTKQIVDALKFEQGRHTAWDIEIPGFGVRITKTGRRTYFLKYRTNQGTQRKPKIGDHGPMTCDQARAIAREWYIEAKSGGDPSAERTASRNGETIKDLVDRYASHYAKGRKKPRSLEEEKRLFRLVILPKFGAQKVAEISRQDIMKVHSALADTPYKANRMLALMSHMMTMAAKWNLRPAGVNPCQGIVKFKETPRNRFLRPDEISKFMETLEADEAANPIPSAFLRLSILTGARKSELLGLRWSEVDLPAGRLNLSDSKTGAKTISLSDQAIKIFEAIPKLQENPYVFTGAREGRPYVSMKRYWDQVRQKTGLTDVRQHDLRHTFASIAAQNGISLHVIGQLMGHKDQSTTSRYAHLIDQTLKDAANKIGEFANTRTSSKP